MMTAPGAECLGRRILVIGDVNTGKTTLCKRWLHELCQRGLDTRIALLDLAPTMAALLGVDPHPDWRGQAVADLLPAPLPDLSVRPARELVH